jgi:hypothetical protein
MTIAPEEIVSWPRLDKHCETVHAPLTKAVEDIKDETRYVKRLLTGLLVSIIVVIAGIVTTAFLTINTNNAIKDNRPQSYYNNQMDKKRSDYRSDYQVRRIPRDTVDYGGQ